MCIKPIWTKPKHFASWVAYERLIVLAIPGPKSILSSQLGTFKSSLELVLLKINISIKVAKGNGWWLKIVDGCKPDQPGFSNVCLW